MHSLQSSTVPFGVDCSLHEQRGLPTIQWFCSVIIVFRPYPVYWHSFLFLLLNLTSLLFLPPLFSPPTLSIPAFLASTSRGHLDLGSWTFQSLKLLKHLQYFFFSSRPIHRILETKTKNKQKTLYHQNLCREGRRKSSARRAAAPGVTAGGELGATILVSSKSCFLWEDPSDPPEMKGPSKTFSR